MTQTKEFYDRTAAHGYFRFQGFTAQETVRLSIYV
jgi:hypothetical protein